MDLSAVSPELHQYIAVRSDFVLKTDGSRPILYPLDVIDTKFFILKPIEGFALALLTGRETIEVLSRQFSYLFPNLPEQAFLETITEVDKLIRQNPSHSGFGKDGLLQISDTPLQNATRYDPRAFVIGSDAYAATMNDVRHRFRLNTPLSILAVPTTRCQTDCVYCYADRQPMQEMPLTRWRELMREMRALDIWLVAQDNGDTFARRDGVAFLESLLEHKFLFMLSTKAHVNKEAVRRLVEAGFGEPVRGVVRKAQLSVDAVDEEVSRRVTQVKGFSNRMMNTFDNFMAFGISPKIKAVMTELNKDQPRKLVSFFYQRGARRFQFVRYFRSFFRHDDSLFLTEESSKRIWQDIEALRKEYPDAEIADDILAAKIDTISQTYKESKWPTRSGCAGGWSMLGISANGAAILCEQMKLDPAYCVGDLSRQGIEEVWNSAELLKFIHPSRESFKGAVCHTCHDFEACIWERGRCYRDAYFCYGSIYEAPPLCPKQNVPGLRMT